MLNTKKVGKKIATLRKSAGYSQEKLSELLGISPQAISKWENGHCLPETALLPYIAELFNCSIDEILMCGVSKVNNASSLDIKIKKITENIVRELGGNMLTEQINTVSDDDILSALYKSEGNLGPCTIERGQNYNITDTSVCEITVKARQIEFELIEKRYDGEDTELFAWDILSRFSTALPHIYYIDFKRKILIAEKIGKNFISGINYDCEGQNGNLFRTQYNQILTSLAQFHAEFWQKNEVAVKIPTTNYSKHLQDITQSLEKYIENEKQNKIPKAYKNIENAIGEYQFNICKKAVAYITKHFEDILKNRYKAFKNVTIIHGNLNPGMINVNPQNSRVLFDNFGFVRTGLATDDLAMLLGSHAFVTKKEAMPRLDFYYQILCEKIQDYNYNEFINDYKYSLAEAVLYTISLMNNGVYDFTMRDKAILAFENFITED